MHAGGLLGQWCLKENSKWKTKPVSGEEGHSTILLAHTKILVWKGPMTMRPWAHVQYVFPSGPDEKDVNEYFLS